MIKKSAFVLATFFGSGLAAKAPGTFGSLATLPLAFIMAYFFGREGVFYAALISFFTGVWAIHQLIKDSDDKDPSKVVIDETAGQLVSFSLVGNLLYQSFDNWYLYIIGFVLFRVFDIIKMGPVKWADSKLHNAWGVMLDDVFAGIFAAVLLLGIEKYFMAF